MAKFDMKYRGLLVDADVGDEYYCTKCEYLGEMARRICVDCKGSEEDDSGDCARCKTGTMTPQCPQCQTYTGQADGAEFAMLDTFPEDLRIRQSPE